MLKVSLSHSPNIAVYPPGATFGPRQTQDFEFVWLLEGEAQYFYEVAGGESIMHLPQNSLLLCLPGRRDRFVWDKTRRTHHGFFHFTLLERSPEWTSPDKWPAVRTLKEGDLLETLSRHLLSWSASGSAAQRDLLVATFLATFLTGESQIGVASHPLLPEAVEKALQFIKQCLEKDAARPPDLKAIAGAAYVSPEHLCRLFKSAVGQSPLQTVRLMRLDRAAVLLARSNFSVAQVAALTGFASPFHFARTFKAAYGLTPRELQHAGTAGQSVPRSSLAPVWSALDVK